MNDECIALIFSFFKEPFTQPSDILLTLLVRRRRGVTSGQIQRLAEMEKDDWDDRLHSGTLGYTRLRFYDINLVSFTIAYHGLNEEIRS